jgi:hypothetical protein
MALSLHAVRHCFKSSVCKQVCNGCRCVSMQPGKPNCNDYNRHTCSCRNCTHSSIAATRCCMHYTCMQQHVFLARDTHSTQYLNNCNDIPPHVHSEAGCTDLGLPANPPCRLNTSLSQPQSATCIRSYRGCAVCGAARTPKVGKKAAQPGMKWGRELLGVLFLDNILGHGRERQHVWYGFAAYASVLATNLK